MSVFCVFINCTNGTKSHKTSDEMTTNIKTKPLWKLYNVFDTLESDAEKVLKNWISVSSPAQCEITWWNWEKWHWFHSHVSVVNFEQVNVTCSFSDSIIFCTILLRAVYEKLYLQIWDLRKDLNNFRPWVKVAIVSVPRRFIERLTCESDL